MYVGRYICVISNIACKDYVCIGLYTRQKRYVISIFTYPTQRSMCSIQYIIYYTIQYSELHHLLTLVLNLHSLSLQFKYTLHKRSIAF